MANKKIKLDHTEAYDFETVKSDTKLICPICITLLKEAMGLPCADLLCNGCLEKLKKSSV